MTGRWCRPADNQGILKNATNSAAELPEVNFSDYAGVRSLHLGTIWIQGSMRLDAPNDIELEYVQRMMAWLLFVEAGSVMKRHAMQLGLGEIGRASCRERVCT